MSAFFGSVWWLLVSLGVLITLHEWGHFQMARRCGVKVLRFSIGFGKPLFSRTSRDGVEYAIGAIPLGGYVKFLDHREADDPARAALHPGEFHAHPPWQRILIAAAGPAVNLAFAVFAFWAMFVIGRPDYPPVIDTPQGLAAEAGLKAGDRIAAVAGEKVDSFTGAMLAVTQAAATHSDVPITVTHADAAARTLTLALSKLPPGAPDSAAVFDRIGLAPLSPPAVAGKVEADHPAARAGMLAGDRIVGINGIAVANYTEFARALAEQTARNPAIDLLVQRNGVTVPLHVVCEPREIAGKTRYTIGIQIAPGPGRDALERFGPLEAVPAAFGEAWKQTHDTLSMIWNMLIGQASVKNLSSVISIAQVANQSAQQGLAWFLSFLAMLSLSLGILNLLPIPVLDGGHIVFTLIEWLKGSPVSERTLIAGQYVGLALLTTLMSLAIYNDLARQFVG